MALSVYSQVPIVDANGDPYVDAYLYFGIPNLDPVANPKTVYDQDGNIIANPVRTNVNGLTTLAVDLDGEYSLIIKNSASVQILSIPEGVYGIGAGGGGGSSTNYWEAVTDSGTGTTVIRIDKAQASYVVLDYTDVLVGTNTSNLPLMENLGGSNWIINGQWIREADSSDQVAFTSKSDFGGQVYHDFKAEAGNNNSYLRCYAAGTGASAYTAYSGATFTGGIYWGADTSLGIVAGGVTAYSVNAAGSVHTWTGSSTSTDYVFKDSGSETFTIDFNFASDVVILDTNKETVRLRGDVYAELATSSTPAEVHYQVSSAGNHYSDDDAYDGTLQPVCFIRSTLKTTSAGTVTMISGVTVTCSKGAAGIYNYTISNGASKTQRAVSTDFVVTGSVPDPGGTSRTLHVDYTGTHTFTVTIHTTGSGNTDAAHRLMIHW